LFNSKGVHHLARNVFVHFNEEHHDSDDAVRTNAEVCVDAFITTRTGATPGCGSGTAAVDNSAEIVNRRLTLCEVVEVLPADTTGDQEGDAQPEQETYVLLGQGIAICHPNDTFSKAVGRKMALHYALQAAFPSDAKIEPEWTNRVTNYFTRADVWTAYLVHFPVKGATVKTGTIVESPVLVDKAA
jgi:hypothetical protein